jgi:hypothetical protein
MQPIDPAAWAACELDLLPEQRAGMGQPAFCIDVAYGMRSAAIAVATDLAGQPYVELADQRSGTEWVIDRVLELRTRFPRALFGGFTNHAVGALMPELALHGVELEKMTDGDMGRACAHMEKMVPVGMRHSPDPLVTVAIGGAVKREIGEGLWAWGRRKSVTDISPLVAVTGALWMLNQVKPNRAAPDFLFL